MWNMWDIFIESPKQGKIITLMYIWYSPNWLLFSQVAPGVKRQGLYKCALVQI